jgi:hypothetical protein
VTAVPLEGKALGAGVQLTRCEFRPELQAQEGVGEVFIATRTAAESGAGRQATETTGSKKKPNQFS